MAKYRKFKRDAGTRRVMTAAPRASSDQARVHNLLGLILYEEDDYAGALAV
jgi:hypothetical protein